MTAHALVTGATGLIGRHCVQRLLASPRYERVVVVARRSTGIQDPKLDERIMDLEQLVSLDVAPVDDVFCALGSVLREAGSWDAFRQVDYDYVVFTAECGLRAGAQQFALVSSIGASVTSPFRYTKLKGQVEAAVSAMPFRAVHIFRPSFLIGEHRIPRPKERLSFAFVRAFEAVTLNAFGRMHSIPGEAVAAAMVAAAEQGTSGKHIYYYDDMLRLARP